MDVQELEDNAEFRIKFASINKRGGYDGDAYHEYRSIFPDASGELADGWRFESANPVQTRFEHTRNSWGLTQENVSEDKYRFAAIEHETGIELLVFPVIAGTISGVGTAVIVGLSVMMWKKWKKSRDPNKLPSSLVMEKVESRKDDKSIQSVTKLEVRGPIDLETVTSTIKAFIDDG